MTIETKYNIGDEVWCLYCRIKKFTIVGVRVTTKDVRKWCIKRFTETVIEYLIDGEWVEESQLVPTKEELLKSL